MAIGKLIGYAFKTTKMKYKAMKWADNLSKNVELKKLGVESEIQDTFTSTNVKYEKNIFKRAINWVKDFFASLKEMKKEFKECKTSAEKKEFWSDLKKDFEEVKAVFKYAKDFVAETIKTGGKNLADDAEKVVDKTV
jgi:hypothetical protein